MAEERDITGRLVQHNVRTMENLRNRLGNKIPYGPARSYMASDDARRAIQDIDPATKQRFMRQVGPDEWQKLMRDVYGWE